MSKRYNIKWTDTDNQRVNRTLKNYNAKIGRLEAKYNKMLANPNLSYSEKVQLNAEKNALPQRIKVGEMRQLIDTRQDLNRELNALERFSRRGAEKIVKIPNTDNNILITEWQKKEMSRRQGIINRARNKRLKEIQEIELEDRGQKLGYTRGQFGMGKADEIALRQIEAFTPSMDRADIHKRYKSFMRQSQSTYYDRRDAQLKENYLKGLYESYNPQDIKEVIEAIQNMDFKEFYRKWQSQGATMEWASPPIPESVYRSYVEALKSQWLPNHAPQAHTNYQTRKPTQNHKTIDYKPKK